MSHRALIKQIMVCREYSLAEQSHLNVLSYKSSWYCGIVKRQ